jgi:hypothetical protein
LLTGEEGWTTVKLNGRPLNVPQTVRIFKQAGVGDIGRVQGARDGGYADLRPGDFGRLGSELEEYRLEAATHVEAAPAETRPRRPARRPENRSRAPRYRS